MGREESLFHTPREDKPTGSEMLESAIKRKEIQRQNRKSLMEANKLSKSTVDFNPILESNSKEAEDEVKKESALEAAYYRSKNRKTVKDQLGLRSRVIKEGKEQVWNNVIGNIIYESYWLDDDVKESTVANIEDSIGQVLTYIDCKCPGSKVPTEKHTKLLKNINSIIESIVAEAADRIVNETIESDSTFSEFELNLQEEEKLDRELSDLGKDEIVDLIKDKVATVIQDEKDKSKKKSDMIKDIEKDSEPDSDDDDDTEDDDSDEDSDSGEKEDKKDEDESEAEESALFGDIIPAKITLESALSLMPTTNDSYTVGERFVGSILESGDEFDAYLASDWIQFKSYITYICKKIKELILTGNCNYAVTAIDDLLNRLSMMPEDVPPDITEFVLGGVGMIYGAVPPDEVIISRINNPMSSYGVLPSGNSSIYDNLSWTDTYVNVRTNLSAIREYCFNKCSGCINEPSNAIEVPPIQENVNTFENLLMRRRNQAFARNVGNTLFEAMMIGNIVETENIAMESMSGFSNEDIEDGALIETLLHYTVFETLETLGLYKFRVSDITNVKKDYMKAVTEGKGPIYGESDTKTMSNGKDKTGKKKVRINTRKLKIGKNKDDDK